MQKMELSVTRFEEKSSRLGPHQRRYMRRDGFRQPVEVVAALQQRDDAILAALLGKPHELLRRPGEIRLGEVEVRQRIAPMRIEPGRDDDEVGPEALAPPQDRRLERLVAD